MLARLVPASIFAALIALLLIAPGHTYVGRYGSDVVGFMDAAARTLNGQVPNVDYSNVLGPLAVLPLAFGAWLGGYGLMFPIGTALALLVAVPIAAYASLRFDRLVGFLFIAFVIILVAAPIVPGDSPRLTTYAMHYNRWSWAFLSLALVTAIPWRRTDAPVLAICLLVLAFLKITFAMVALVFVLACTVLFPDRRKTFLLSLAMFATVAIATGFLWGGVPGYIADLRNATAQSGALRGGLSPVFGIFLWNVTDFSFLAVVLLLAYRRGADRRYLLLALMMALAGIALFNQTGQTAGVMTVVPAALVAMFAPAKNSVNTAERATFAALVFSLIANPAVSILWQARMAAAAPEEQILGIVTSADTDMRSIEASYRTASMDPRVLAQITVHGISELDRFYFRTLRDGAKLIQPYPGKVMTMDMANPFSAALGRVPPRGPDIFPVIYRTIGYQQHPTGEKFFGDADLVMIPKFPRNVETRNAQVDIYRQYLKRHYRVAVEDPYWTLLQRTG